MNSELDFMLKDITARQCKIEEQLQDVINQLKEIRRIQSNLVLDMDFISNKLSLGIGIGRMPIV